MTDQIVFSGSLRFISLNNVFQLLGENNCTGILSLRSDYTEFLGVIYFADGNPINGSFGELKGLKAVQALFGWIDGNYEFHEREISHINPAIKQSRKDVVLQALKMLSDGEIKKIGPLMPDKIEIKNEKVESQILNQPIESLEHVSVAISGDSMGAGITMVVPLALDQMEMKDEEAEAELFNLFNEPLEHFSVTISGDSADAGIAKENDEAPDQMELKNEETESEFQNLIVESLEHVSVVIPDDSIFAETAKEDALVPDQVEIKKDEAEDALLSSTTEPLEHDTVSVPDDSIDAEITIADFLALNQMEMQDEEAESESPKPVEEPLERVCARCGTPLDNDDAEESLFSSDICYNCDAISDYDNVDAETTTADPFANIQMEMETEKDVFSLNIDSLEDVSAPIPDDSMGAGITKGEPLGLEHLEMQDEEAESESPKPVEEPLERVCVHCGISLGADGAEESLFSHNVCFNCDAISGDDSMDAEVAKAEPAAPIQKKMKKEETKKEPLKPTAEPLKHISAAIPGESISAKLKKSDPVAPKQKGMIKEEAKKAFLNPAIEPVKQVSATIPDEPMDEDESNLLSKLKSMFKTWGFFHYFVTASILMVWVALGIIFLSGDKSSSQKPELAIPEKNVSKTQTSEPVKIVQQAENQAAPVVNNAGSLKTQAGTPGQVKPVQVAETKPAPVANNANSLNTRNLTSAQVATPQAKEKESTPAPVEKIEQPPQVVVQQANLAGKDTVPMTTRKEVVETQAPVTENEVKKMPDSTKSAIENNEAAKKTEEVKLIPPVKEAEVKEQIVKPSIITKDPEFSGGKAALAKWLGSHITIPSSVTRSGIEGNVIVELTIDPKGNISNVAIVKSLQKQCDQEVIRVVSGMPKWKPGEVNGVKTISKYNLSVRFSAR